MSLKDDAHIREYIQRCDSPFAVVNKIAQLAREKEQDCNNHILHSEAITWVVQGVEPAKRDKDTFSKLPSVVKNENKLNEVLCYIDDTDICKAVRESFITSKHNKFLTFIYNDIADEPRKCRVRVLTRMLWYED